MNKEIFVLPIESSTKRPPVFGFFSTTLFLVLAYFSILIVESVVNLINSRTFLEFDFANLSTTAIALGFSAIFIIWIILKENILRSKLLNKVYFYILSSTVAKIIYIVLNSLVLLLTLGAQVTYDLTYYIVSPIRFFAALIFVYLTVVMFLKTRKYKSSYNLIDSLRNSKFIDEQTPKSNKKFSIRKQSLGIEFIYFNLGTIDLINQKEEKVKNIQNDLNILFESNEKYTKRFKVFLLHLPPSLKLFFEENDPPIKSVVLRVELNRKDDFLEKTEIFYEGLKKQFETVIILDSSFIKYFYLSVLGFTLKNSNIKNIDDIDTIFLGLKAKKISDNRIKLESSLNKDAFNSELYFSSLYNIENNNENRQDEANIYKFSENPLYNILNKINSDQSVAVLTFERIKNASSKDNELTKRVSKGVEHKRKDLDVIDTKIDKTKVELMKKSHEDIEKVTKFDSSGNYFVMSLEAIYTNNQASTFKLSSYGITTEIANQNFVQHYALKNLLGISTLEKEYTFLNGEFLIKSSSLFMLGMFYQENTYEEGKKSIFLGKLKDSTRGDIVKIDMGRYQSTEKARFSNGHVVILAKSGSGKTTLIKSLIYQKLAFNNQQVIILDKEPEYADFGEEVKFIINEQNSNENFSIRNYTSEFIDQNSINPFNIPLTEEQESQLKDKKSKLNYKVLEGEFENHVQILINFFNGIIEKVDEKISTHLNNKLKKAILNTYRVIKLDREEIIRCFLSPPNLKDFIEELKKVNTAKKVNRASHEIYKDVKFVLDNLIEDLKENKQLRKYFGSSNKMSELNDVLNTTNLIIFDTKDLVSTKEKRLYFTFLINYLKTLILATPIVNVGQSENTKFAGGKALFVDELHSYFEVNQNKSFSIFITDFLKDAATRFRKRNVELIVASQQTTFSKLLDQVLNKNAKDLLTQATYRFYGMLEKEDKADATESLSEVLTDKDLGDLKLIQTPFWALSQEGKKLIFIDIVVHKDVYDFVVKKISRRKVEKN
jgi:DNA helicase HerA-like ATPase